MPVREMCLRGEGVSRDDLSGYARIKVAAEVNYAAYRQAAHQIETSMTLEQMKTASALAQ